MQQKRRPSKKSLQALDLLNLFLADVRDGVGPYLNIYLKTSQHWNPQQIGIVTAVSSIATVISQTPAGALIDRLRQKRMLVVLAAALVTMGSFCIALFPVFPVVIASQIVIGIAAAIFPPAIAALTLGLVGPQKLDQRIGRNETFNHSGNLLAAVLSGFVGQFMNSKGIFFLVGIMAIASAYSVLRIREQEIDHELARGDGDHQAETEEDNYGSGKKENYKNHNQHKYESLLNLLSDRVARPMPQSRSATLPCASGIRRGFLKGTLWAYTVDRRILLFTTAVVLFHFANAAMLPLVGQLLDQGGKGKGLDGTVYMSACIITAQLFMVVSANIAGRLADRGRKPIFLVGFGVLPIRGVLYTLSHNPFFLVSVQILDGIAGGIFGVISVLMVADLTKGSGRFNLTQGLLATSIGIGAGLSNLLAGFVAGNAGYDVAFLMLAAIAVVALAILWFFVPETKQQKSQTFAQSRKI